ncbi:L-carnitine dehydratase/bile acid-inducible protein F [hydrothermal vent metagenome]|uniref:L-carnitine dehydratase/bile acid-inducible protein F n=1 Tax=hydrothermal vent metagenome TaxID=652676 RepID=A0A3B0USE0_9ZZZZ
MTQTLGLLNGIRIIDLTRVLAGPYCTQLLGDLGADVIKIEAPGRGDDTRHWGPPFTDAPDGERGESAYFLAANRNKRSLTLNLKSEKGLEILKGLIRQGDVLVENFRTGTLARWGLDYKALQTVRPGLIYCAITGYGSDGPYKDRAGYDFMVQAMGGFMSVTGPADGDMTRAGIAIGDLATGIFASNAILAALFARERTGQGQRIDMALLDSQVALMSYVASNYLVSGELPGRFGNGHPNIVPYQEFQARDQQFAFACGNDNQWQKFCTAVSHPEWITDERFATNTARIANRATVIDMLNELFASRNAAEWMALCDEISIPSAPINDMAQVFDNPQVKARNTRLDIPHPTAGSVPLVNSPLKIPTNPTSVRYPPPTLGQHSNEILQELLGYNKTAVNNLRKENIV